MLFRSIFFGLLLAIQPVTVRAEVVCTDHRAIVTLLAESWSEVRAGIGLSRNGSVVEIYTSPAGSWTLLVTWPDGRTCLLDSGQAWEQVPAPLPCTPS